MIFEDGRHIKMS